uniref:Uncharacterized protein n=1 Tax=Mammaliicoccus phage MSShimriz1 TaxID=3230127 RepID=A0AAU8GVE6_9VIRU
MYCECCGSKTKNLNKDVIYSICKNVECRHCEITEPPNMMGDISRTYYTELSLERWCMLLDKNIRKQRHKLNNPKTYHQKVIEYMDITIRQNEYILELIKENKQLKKEIKKLKGE